MSMPLAKLGGAKTRGGKKATRNADDEDYVPKQR